MNKALDSSSVLRWLAERIDRPQWTSAGSVLTGMLGSSAVRGRGFSSGATVAIALTRPLSKTAEACLLLAATPEACDDALYVADKQLWLLRRYMPGLTETELDLLFKQQQALGALLISGDDGEAAPLPIAGRYV